MNHIEIAQAYRRHLPAGVLHTFRIDALDRLGVPVVTVRLTQDDGTTFEGIGYGATAEEAMVGALGELSEEAHCERALRDMPRVVGSHVELLRQRGERGVADPLTLCLPAGSSYLPEQPLVWVAATRVATGEPVLVPEEFAADSSRQLRCRGRASMMPVVGPPLIPPATPLVTPITNGLGAGTSFAQALVHGLLELLQRDGNGILFRALDQGVLLDLPDDIPASTQALLAKFQAAGIEVMPKFATDEFGIANLYCVGRERDGYEPTASIMLTGCGEAAHPDRGQALDKALCEFAASRVRKAFAHGPAVLAERVAPPNYVAQFMARSGAAAKSSDPRALNAMREWSRASSADLRHWLADTVHAVRSHKAFDTLPCADVPSGHVRSKLVLDAVLGQGFDVLYVDMSPPGAPLATVKVIVPGLEVETMSYARIGERNARKLLQRDTGLVGFGECTGQSLPIRLTPEAIGRLGGVPWFDIGRATQIVGPLYPLYREPEAHHLAQSESQP